MNDRDSDAGWIEGQKRAAKQLRKQVRKFIRNDLQRRAITGEPSPFKRAEQL